MTKIRARVNNAGVYLLFVAALIGFVSARAQADVPRVFEEKAGPIPEFVMTFAAGQTITFHTENLSGGVDPVLHFWDIANDVEVSMDDNNGGGKKALLRARAPHAGDYLLIVRQRNFLAEGTLDIFMFNQPWKTNVKVGGRFVIMLSLQPKEQIDVLPPPQGPSSHVMYVISEDGLHLESRLHGAPRSRWEIPNAISGARTLLLGVQDNESGKPIRVYRNDFKLSNSDIDGDNLGIRLERQLKTCSAHTDSFDAFTCKEVRDMRDTDGDGLSDGWEVLGRDYSPDIYLALPTWGANPRHKDMFIEADYRRLTQEENDAQIAEHMPPEVARQVADAYGDMKTTDPLLRLFHAASVGNPDQQPGISVHIDTGLNPQTPKDAGIYGDWGGYDAIDAITDKDGNVVGQDPGKLWKTHMHPSRRGIFLYGPGHKSGGASCILGGRFCGYNFNEARVAIHEMLHVLGLDHSAPKHAEKLGANCKPNYPSAVNYAFQEDLLLSDGRNRPPLNNTALKEWKAAPPFNKRYIDDLQNRFKYLVEPLNGHVDWNRDGVFAPADQTVRGYANYAPGKNCEFTRVNEVEFSDTEAISVALVRVGKHTLLFYVDTKGKMRYRRSTSSWKCSAAEKKCSGSSFGSASSISFPGSIKIQSMDAEPVNIDGTEQVSIVAIDRDGGIHERRLTLKSNGDLAWVSATTEISSAVPAAGEPSLAETRDGTALFLMYKGTDNVLRWRFRNTADWSDERVAQDQEGNNLVAALEASPGIATAYLPGAPEGTAPLYLVYSDARRILRFMTLNLRGRWENANLLSKLTSNMQGRPAMAWVPNTMGFESPGQFYVVLRDEDSRYIMMRTYFDTGFNKILVGLDSYFDNSSLFGNTIDLIASSSSGHPQLWAVLTFAKKDSDGDLKPLILFRPRADGISDIKQVNYDDWTAVGSSLCNIVVNPDGKEKKPIRCPKWPWKD